MRMARGVIAAKLSSLVSAIKWTPSSRRVTHLHDTKADLKLRNQFRDHDGRGLCLEIDFEIMMVSRLFLTLEPSNVFFVISASSLAIMRSYNLSAIWFGQWQWRNRPEIAMYRPG